MDVKETNRSLPVDPLEKAAAAAASPRENPLEERISPIELRYLQRAQRRMVAAEAAWNEAKAAEQNCFAARLAYQQIASDIATEHELGPDARVDLETGLITRQPPAENRNGS